MEYHCDQCKEEAVKKLLFTLFAGMWLGSLASSQAISFGFSDPVFEASLNDIGASAKVDLPGFSAEVSLQWGLDAPLIQASLSQGLTPAEVYLAAGLASISGKPMAVVVDAYKRNKSKGWGFVAKELGIKPGSKEFKALKDKSAGSASKMKKGKKK
jgi:hypothetical protein